MHAVVREHPGATVAENAARLRLPERENHEGNLLVREIVVVGEWQRAGGVIAEAGVLLLERGDLRSE